MTDTSKSLERSGRRGRRRLSPVQKYEAFVQVLTGEMTVVQCADHWGVDRSTIMRAREVAKRGAHATAHEITEVHEHPNTEVQRMAARVDLIIATEATRAACG